MRRLLLLVPVAVVLAIGPAAVAGASVDPPERWRFDSAASASSRAVPFGAQIKSHSFNHCALVCLNDGIPGGGRFVARDLGQFFMAVDSPQVVGYQEICWFDANHIKNQTGYPQPALYKAVSSTQCDFVPGFGFNFGNAAYVTGSSPRGGYERQFNAQDGGAENRGMACAWAATFIGRLVSCSAHFDTTISIARTQSNEYSYIAAVNPDSGSTSLRWLSGDFNLQPHQLTAVWGSSYGRINNGVTFSTLTGLNRTLDYMHVLNPNLISYTASTYCDAGRSDHCYLTGVAS